MLTFQEIPTEQGERRQSSGTGAKIGLSPEGLWHVTRTRVVLGWQREEGQGWPHRNDNKAKGVGQVGWGRSERKRQGKEDTSRVVHVADRGD